MQTSSPPDADNHPRDPSDANGESLVRTAFRARLRSAMERVLREATDEQLAEALAAPSDVGMVARALLAVGVGPVRAIDPFAGAMARGIEQREELLRQAGALLSAEEAGRILGIGEEDVDQIRREAHLLALNVEGDWVYPAFQFTEDDVLPGIQTIVSRMAGSGPWMTLDLLLAPDSALSGRNLLEVVRAGESDLVDRILRLQEADGYS